MAKLEQIRRVAPKGMLPFTIPLPAIPLPAFGNRLFKLRHLLVSGFVRIPSCRGAYDGGVVGARKMNGMALVAWLQ